MLHLGIMGQVMLLDSYLLFFRFAIIVCDIQGGQKVGPQTHDHNSVKSEPI